MKLKIVYFGPGLAGKTTNVEQLYKFLQRKGLVKSELLKMETDERRTFFIETFIAQIPLNSEEVEVKVLTTPGQFRLNPLRKAVVKDADGFVFVVDSNPEVEVANILTLKEMTLILKELGRDIKDIPIVVQYNKRDLPNALPVDYLNDTFNIWNTEYVEAIAKEGIGVVETFKLILKKTLLHLRS